LKKIMKKKKKQKTSKRQKNKRVCNLLGVACPLFLLTEFRATFPPKVLLAFQPQSAVSSQPQSRSGFARSSIVARAAGV
jgi:hypothetical protein